MFSFGLKVKKKRPTDANQVRMVPPPHPSAPQFRPISFHSDPLKTERKKKKRGNSRANGCFKLWFTQRSLPVEVVALGWRVFQRWVWGRSRSYIASSTGHQGHRQSHTYDQGKSVKDFERSSFKKKRGGSLGTTHGTPRRGRIGGLESKGHGHSRRKRVGVVKSFETVETWRTERQTNSSADSYTKA